LDHQQVASNDKGNRFMRKEIKVHVVPIHGSAEVPLDVVRMIGGSFLKNFSPKN